MKTKIIYFAVISSLCFLSRISHAQTPEWVWAKSANGTSLDMATFIVMAPSGNILVAGRFQSPTIAFGSTTLTNVGYDDIFLAKYDVNGNVLWAKSAGGTKEDVTTSIAVDVSGNTYMAGYFASSTIIFGSDTLMNTGNDDIFLTKYDVNGNVLWAKNIGGTNNDKASSITVDASGNAYLVGYFNSPTITFDSTTLTNTGNYDIFLAKFDASGNLLWLKNEGGTGDEKAYSVAVDASGNSCVAGYFASSTIIIGSTTLTNAGSNDIFLAKYDTNGNVLWVKSVGGTSDDCANSVSVDASGNTYIVGKFSSPTIIFDSTTLTNAGSDDIFLVKYDTNGNVLFAKSTGGTSDDCANSVSVDASGNTYIVGWFNSPTIIFGSTTLTSAGLNDLFLTKYDINGNVLWAKRTGGTRDDKANSVTMDVSGNTYIAGYYTSSTITFGSTTLTNSYVGFNNIFLAKYNSTGNALWAKSVGGYPYDEFAYSVAVDTSMNSYVAGVLECPILVLGSTTLTNGSPKYNDIFLAKYNSNGNVIWAKSAGGTNDEMVTSTAVDVSGNIYVAGYYKSTIIHFDSDTLTNVGLNDIFLTKYDANGNVLWVKSAGGTKDDYANSVTVDVLGNVYLGGHFFSAMISFDTINLTNVVSTGNTSDIFLVKYDANGNIIWAKSNGGTGSDIANSIAIDVSENIYVTGSFHGPTAIFGTTTLTNSTVGYDDLFFVKYDTSGNVLWAKSAGGTKDDEAKSIAVNILGNVYFTGYFSSPTITFGTTSLTNVGSNVGDIFIVKCDFNGNVLWAKSAGGTQGDYVYSIATDMSGNIYLTGDFNSPTMIFDTIGITAINSGDIYLAKYDENGNPIWAKCIGGTKIDYTNAVAVDILGNTYLTGYFNSPSITFDSIIVTNIDVSYYTFFIAKLDNSVATGTNELSNSLIISIFPNPSTDYITIIIPEEATIVILNIDGQIIKTINNDSNETTIYLGNLSSGVYIIKAITDKGITMKKFIKQ